jgi:tetratricopeptide (TPR) repeat protein
MVCPSCGTANPEAVRFCGQCGTALSESDRTVSIFGGSAAGAAAASAAPQPQVTAGLMSPPPDVTAGATWAGAGTGLSAVLPPGSPFGTRYRIEKLLGEGGMGAVYKAYDVELGRFKQELLLASKISHKNILRIHDIAEWNGVKFITMAFVEGCDLAVLMEQTGRLPFDRALKFTRQLCLAMEAAHEAGVVHRDLKPQNILIDKDDNTYISDFGLAKSLETEATQMTRTGQILGTPRYMSPEQVEAGDTDHRSDLYSLGLIIYEMFTAELPFRGDSAMQLMYQRVATEPKDPREIVPGLPDYIATVILKCLQKDADKRYQNAREILTDLDSQQAPVLPPSRPAAGNATISIQLPRPSRRGTFLTIGALVLLLGIPLAIPGIRDRIFHSGTAAPAIQYRMAVLPLRNMGDESMKFVADGIGDALSAKLAGLQNVYVASGSMVASAMALHKDQKELATALGVSVLVQGQVQSSAEDVQVVISADDVKTNSALLHKPFNGTRKDLLSLEDHIFGGLTDALTIKLSSDDQARTMRPTEQVDAYETYLRGRDLLKGQQTISNFQNAMGLFQQATDADPRFALAFTGMADSDMRLYDQTKDTKYLDQADAAAERAKLLNPELLEAHVAMGAIDRYRGRTEESLGELQLAQKMAPHSDEALRNLGRAYLQAGKAKEAIDTLTEATKVNPYYWNNFNQLGYAYFQLGRNDEAVAQFNQVIGLEPNRPTGYAFKGAVLLREGKFDEAIPLLQKANDLQPSAQAVSNVGFAYYHAGKYGEAQKKFEQAVKMAPKEAIYRGNLADAYRASNQRDKAMAAYDEAIRIAFASYQVNPQDAATIGNLAIYYAKKGDAQRALNFIQKARSIDSKANALMYKEATIDAIAGRTADALKMLGDALRSGFSLQEANSDPELASLRKTPEYSRLQQDIAAQIQK